MPSSQETTQLYDHYNEVGARVVSSYGYKSSTQVTFAVYAEKKYTCCFRK